MLYGSRIISYLIPTGLAKLSMIMLSSCPPWWFIQCKSLIGEMIHPASPMVDR